ncbi:MAG: TonB-dependent receptor [Acidobacteria bacterium]|nr:TonB-dependent receptor [Acidobacteriota bacterium]
MIQTHICRGVFLLSVMLWPVGAAAGRQQAALSGVALDPPGARVPGAAVTLVAAAGRQVRETTTDGDGAYRFEGLADGRYQVVATAPGFEAFTSDPVYVSGGARPVVNVMLHVGPLRQAVVVTAAASDIPQSQTGAPVTVIDTATLDALNKADVLEALRLVPGSHVVQTGARGATTAMFIRGGAANFNKVLVDGVPANDIGGAFDFAQMSTTGIDRVEVLRQTNSVMYGSDALAGVIAITTRRGRTRVPEVTYSADGGNLGTFATEAGIGGAVRRFDYYSMYSRFRTDNDVPNNAYRNGTYAGRFGVALGGATDLSGTIRRADTRYESPNAVRLYGIPDDSAQDTDLTYASVAAQSQITNVWQGAVRFGATDQTLRYVNPTPTGEPVFGNYLGRPVTLRGNNGHTVAGRAILDFFGTYPSVFQRRTTRLALAGDTTYQLTATWAISGGARFEREQGYNDPKGDPTATRTNGGGFVEVRGAVMNRHHVSAGLGVEHNAVFGEAVTPRVSVASYLRQPSSRGFGDTRLVLNAGTGIKAPSVFQEQSSLYALVKGTPAGAGVEPIGPERSRSFDIGVEQAMAGGRVRARLAYFHNTFTDLIEFLSKTALPRAGVPQDVANATPFGAYINSQSYRADGVETSVEAAVARDLRLTGSYTYLDAEVTEAFSASAAFNPAFPNIAIGAFSPLVGQRPFRRPPHSGALSAIYTRQRGHVALTGYFSGAWDDSTFLTDQFFGNSLLLPNRDLAAGYQKIDLSGSYRVHPRLEVYTSIENLLDRDYEQSFGFPALPLTARLGFRVTFGGD